MQYNILKTEPTWGERIPKIIATVESLYEAEMLKQKFEREDKTWSTYEIKMC